MAPTFDDFVTRLARIVEEEVSALTPDRELLSVPLWDSLAIVTFMAVASETYDRLVEPERIAAAKTVGDLFTVIESESAS